MEPKTTMRAIGIARQSRSRDDSQSPEQQAERIRQECQRRGLQLVEVIEERDVSGGTPLERRHGLRRAVEAVEAGEAEVIVGAYFDRLVRSLRVQAELVERVEAADGQVLALDTGQVTNGTPGQWLSSSVLGLMAEYVRRTTADRVGVAQAAAVERGVCPFPLIPPGLRRVEVARDGLEVGQLEPHPEQAPVVAEALAMRARGATWKRIRAYLAAHRIERSLPGTRDLLRSRLLIGEIHFGELVNWQAHEPIVDREVFEAAQRTRGTGGRYAKSERLLARLGVLRCGSCDSRMIVASSTSATAHRGRFPTYRCASADCPRRMAISAAVVEAEVERVLVAKLGDAEGRASAELAGREAEQRAADAESRLQEATEQLTAAGLLTEPGAIAGLGALRQERDEAREKVERSRPTGGRERVLRMATDWERLALAERRDLIRAAVDRVDVAPGRGVGRITVTLVGG